MKRCGRFLLLFVCAWILNGTLILAQPNKAKPKTSQKVKAAAKPVKKPVAILPKKTTTPIKSRKDSLNNPILRGVANAQALPVSQLDTIEAKTNFSIYTTNAGSAKSDNWFINKPVTRTNTDYLFYLMAAMVLLLGTIRYLFPKYFGDLFGLFFKVTFRQKAVRERLLENSIPSMMLNGLFVCSGGLFLLFISQYYQWALQKNFWYNLGFWVLLLTAVYGFKLILLRSMGWLFQMHETSNTYSFIVFMVSKVTGVLLIPFIVLLAFGPSILQPVLVTAALVLLVGMFAYRYLISYPSVRSSLRLNQFHFFLYLCAFEIVPLLLIYKGLAVHFSKAT